ncbi:DUF5106 domain-containing protein [Marinilabiliaceae bacterium JC017]|nr:DUF5106 domain-containing protein [Marinilabiliaceae bacterium JC017]
MLKQIKLLSILFSFILLGQISFAQSYNIKVQVEGIKDTSLILGYYFNKQMYVKDTIQVDATGKGTFSGEEPLKGGIYVVYMPDQSYFDLLINEDQDFSVSTKAGDFIPNMKINGSKESENFLHYQRFLLKKQKEAKVIQDQLKNIKKDTQKYNELKDQLKALSKTVENHWKTTIKENKGTFLAAFILSLQDIEVPEFTVPETTQNKDSVLQWKRYEYYKEHYFDNIDLTDDRLLRTPIFTNKVDNFFTKTLFQVPDTLTKEAIKLIEKSKENEEVYRYLVQYLFNMANDSKIMGMDAMVVALGEKYYLSGKATWADSTFLKNLDERVTKMKPNLLGKTAYDMKMVSYTGEHFRLSEISAPITILLFWEPDCGHCKKEVPKIKTEVWDKYNDKGIKVFAVYTQLEKEPWVDFITKNHLEEFINVYDPYLRSDFRNQYDIYSTPIIYILDKDKKIIAKRIGSDQVPGFLDHYFKQL